VKNINLLALFFFLLAEINGNKLQVKLPLKAAKGEIHEIVRLQVVQCIQELLGSVEDTASHAEREELKLVIEEHLKDLYHKSALLTRCEQQANMSCWREKKLLEYEVANFKKQLSEYIEQVIRKKEKNYSLKGYLTVGFLITGALALAARLKKAWNDMNSAQIQGGKRGDEGNEKSLFPGQDKQPNPSLQTPAPHLISDESLKSVVSPSLQSPTQRSPHRVEEPMKKKVIGKRIVAVFYAILKNDSGAFKKALESLLPSDDINGIITLLGEYEYEGTLLYAVARYTDNPDMVRDLVAKDADIWKGKKDLPPLASALAHGHYQVARVLIELGNSKRAIGEVIIKGLPLLVWFCKGKFKDYGDNERNLDMLRYLLENGAGDVNQRVIIGNNEETVFSCLFSGNREIFDDFNEQAYRFLSEALKEIIKKVDFKISQNRLIVNTVVKRNDKRLVDVLVGAGAPINESDEKDGNTPLHLAVLNGNEAIVSKLLENNANMYLENKNKESAIQLAQKYNRYGILRKFATEIALRRQKGEILSPAEHWEEEILKSPLTCPVVSDDLSEQEKKAKAKTKVLRAVLLPGREKGEQGEQGK
jgi:Ankyrin repeats (3 copies)